jgi:hypothetical protein
MNGFQRRILSGLDAVGARYLVIGAQSMRAHGVNRHTQDLDLLLSPHREDAAKLLGVLVQIDARFALRISIDDLLRPLLRIPIHSTQGVEVDLLTTIDGIDFEGAFGRRQRLRLDGQVCNVAAVADIIAMKELSQTKCRADAVSPSMTRESVQRALAMANKDAADIELLRALQFM